MSILDRAGDDEGAPMEDGHAPLDLADSEDTVEEAAQADDAAARSTLDPESAMSGSLLSKGASSPRPLPGLVSF